METRGNTMLCSDITSPAWPSFFDNSSAPQLLLLNGPFSFRVGGPLGGNGFAADPQLGYTSFIDSRRA